MLNNISWQGYWTTIVLLTLAYYIVLYLVYFRRQLPSLLAKRESSPKQPTASPAVASFLQAQNQPSLFPEETADEFTVPDGEEGIVYACMDELNAYFEGAKKQKIAKPELLFALQRILAKHPSLKQSAYKASLSNVIVSEAEHHCSLHLSEAEVVQVWAG